MTSAQTKPTELASGVILTPADPHMRELAWFIGEWRVQSRMLTDAATDLCSTRRCTPTIPMRWVGI
ncbi:MAG: hypothetical protein KJ065_18190 [Anaerolineae bacterium]|nr:hypothetical protein [Anaerolineae bacterium]